jgi:hypothetical protein
MDHLTLVCLVLLAVFIGALMRATFGFGEAVVSMPLLALLPVDLHTSIALIGLAGVTVAVFTISAGWRILDWAILMRLATAALLGIPAGLVLVTFAPARFVTCGLGIFLVIYGVYALVKPIFTKKSVKAVLSKPAWALAFGFASGALGSAYNFNGECCKPIF